MAYRKSIFLASGMQQSGRKQIGRFVWIFHSPTQSCWGGKRAAGNRMTYLRSDCIRLCSSCRFRGFRGCWESQTRFSGKLQGITTTFKNYIIYVTAKQSMFIRFRNFSDLLVTVPVTWDRNCLPCGAFREMSSLRTLGQGIWDGSTSETEHTAVQHAKRVR